MIARIRGTVSEVRKNTVLLDVDDLTYEVFIPAVSVGDLQMRVAQRVTLFTLEYIEGNTSFGNLAPRLVGFLSEAERDFFLAFIKVPGIGISKGLKAMTVPTHEIAGAIEARNIPALSRLPGIGRRTAEKAIAELNGKLAEFHTGRIVQATTAVEATIQDAAIEALIGLGYRRPEAEDLVRRTMAGGSTAVTVEKLVQDCFRHAKA